MAINAIVGTQSYCWHQICEAEGKKLAEHQDEVLGQVAAAGFQAWEPVMPGSPAEIAELRKLLAKYNLKMPSVYTGGRLHEGEWQRVVDQIVRSAGQVRPLGVAIIVINPDPIGWGKAANKTDDQLRRQAEAMQSLGERLLAEGLSLAYHTHDPEMRASAREFHHMMLATDPRHLGLCLDAHWIYRGAENSQVALYDIVKLYLPRIRSLHLRQSKGGIWTEVLGEGDIDYGPLVRQLREANFQGVIINEQCLEQGTPRTLSAVERQKRGRQWIRETFGV